MKFVIIIAVLIWYVQIPVVAQHPLVGTWEMISVKGTDADGDPFFFDTTMVRETKIITPTHYILIAWDVDGDSLIFNRTMAGHVRFDGNKYIEVPTQASVQIFENIDVDFSWKIERDIFTQSGTIVRPDGKKVVLEALIFRRVSDVVPQNTNPAIGTWNQVDAHFTGPDGKSSSNFNAADRRLFIVTPTHWMRMDHRGDKFDGVVYGTYTMQGDTVSTRLTYSSYPFSENATSKFQQKVNGTRAEMTSAGLTPQGERATFHDILERQ